MFPNRYETPLLLRTPHFTPSLAPPIHQPIQRSNSVYIDYTYPQFSPVLRGSSTRIIPQKPSSNSHVKLPISTTTHMSSYHWVKTVIDPNFSLSMINLISIYQHVLRLINVPIIIHREYDQMDVLRIVSSIPNLTSNREGIIRIFCSPNCDIHERTIFLYFGELAMRYSNIFKFKVNVIQSFKIDACRETNNTNILLDKLMLILYILSKKFNLLYGNGHYIKNINIQNIDTIEIVFRIDDFSGRLYDVQILSPKLSIDAQINGYQPVNNGPNLAVDSLKSQITHQVNNGKSLDLRLTPSTTICTPVAIEPLNIPNNDSFFNISASIDTSGEIDSETTDITNEVIDVVTDILNHNGHTRLHEGLRQSGVHGDSDNVLQIYDNVPSDIKRHEDMSNNESCHSMLPGMELEEVSTDKNGHDIITSTDPSNNALPDSEEDISNKNIQDEKHQYNMIHDTDLQGGIPNKHVQEKEHQFSNISDLNDSVQNHDVNKNENGDMSSDLDKTNFTITEEIRDLTCKSNNIPNTESIQPIKQSNIMESEIYPEPIVQRLRIPSEDLSVDLRPPPPTNTRTLTCLDYIWRGVCFSSGS